MCHVFTMLDGKESRAACRTCSTVLKLAHICNAGCPSPLPVKGEACTVGCGCQDYEYDYMGVEKTVPIPCFPRVTNMVPTGAGRCGATSDPIRPHGGLMAGDRDRPRARSWDICTGEVQGDLRSIPSLCMVSLFLYTRDFDRCPNPCHVHGAAS